MKNTLLRIVFILILGGSIHSYAQPTMLGCDTIVCGQSTFVYSDSVYTIQAGSTTQKGYKIYRNGIEVFSKLGYIWSDGGYICRYLKFIDNSTGFLIDDSYQGPTRPAVYRSSDGGTTWTLLKKLTTAIYLGNYIVDQYSDYLIAYSYPGAIQIVRCSSLSVPAWQIFDTSMSQDIYRQDSIVYKSLCNKDSLRIYIKNGTDTITYNIKFSGTVGIHEANNDVENLSLYPNPATNDLFLNGNTNFSFTIRDANGRYVLIPATEEKDNYKTDISNLDPGVYFIEIKTAQSILNRKLVIVR